MVVTSFCTFWLAEDPMFKFSGILALAALGLGLSAVEQSTIDRKIIQACHGFW